MKAQLQCAFARCREWLSDNCCTSSTVESDVVAETRYARRGRTIASFLCSCGRNEHVIPSLKWRKDYGRWVSIGPDGAEAFRQLLQRQLDDESLRNVPRFRTFDLYGLRIGDEGTRALLPIFEMDKSISSLILSENGITDAVISELLMHLSRSPGSLRVLSLVGNPITAKGIKIALSSFTSLTFSVEELSLSRGCISHDRKVKTSVVHNIPPATPVFLADDVEVFLEFLNKSDSILKCFSYHGNQFEDFGADDFGKILEAAICSRTIRHIVLQDCYTSQALSASSTELTEKLAAPFEIAAKALQSINATLTTLELQIPLSDEAVSAFASGIASATRLVRLSLRGCYMSAEGLRIFSEVALSSNCSIVSLDLSYQSEEVSHPLCDSHWMSRLLTGHVNSSINLSRRPLLPVFQALNCNSTLETLNVLGIDILPDDVEELCACIESGRNTVIRAVRYSELSSEPLTIKLENLLARNRNVARNPSHATTAKRRSSALDALRRTVDISEEENENAKGTERAQRVTLPKEQPHAKGLQQEKQKQCTTAKVKKQAHSQLSAENSLPHDIVPSCYVDAHSSDAIVDFNRQEIKTECEEETSANLAHNEGVGSPVDKYGRSRTQKKRKWSLSSVTNDIFSPRSEVSVSYVLSS